MRISIVAEPTIGTYDGNAITAEFVREYIDACQYVIVPGVAGWDDIVTRDLPDGRIAITADITTDEDTGPDHGREKVTPAFISSYITGAEDNWLIPSSLFASEVSVTA